jgi:pimeloyl-ACP methyl ester carboxylesterase
MITVRDVRKQFATVRAVDGVSLEVARLLRLAACLLMLGIASRVPAQSPLQRCTIAGQPARCGSLSVPEDHRTANGRRIELRTVILERQEEDGESRDPVFVLAGGPGQAATDLTDWAADILQDARRTRDIVLIDQRGTGGANRLACALAPQSYFVPANPERCAARLARKAKLSLYGTESVIEDIELTRRMLGYPRIVVVGASYGTRAAYAYARKYPASVRAAVLMAPAPVSMPILDSFAEDGRRSLDAIIADCLTNESCATAFPHLHSDVERLRAETMDPFRVLGLQFLQYSTATIVDIPRVITRAASGDLDPLDSAIARFREQIGEQLALGLHLTIVCGEDLPFGASESNSVARQQYARACRGWPSAGVSHNFHDPVRLSVPALILVGEWDPVTSPRWARRATEQFSPTQLVVLPKAGHLLDGYRACAGKLIVAFLDQHAADTSCVATVRAPRFVVK